MLPKITIFNKLLLCLLLIFPHLVLAEPIWIDVRTPAEYQIDHIEGDLLIPHNQIATKIEQMFPDRDTHIHLYCRSGNRSGIAQKALQKLGYKNVFNEGSIEQARVTKGATK